MRHPAASFSRGRERKKRLEMHEEQMNAEEKFQNLIENINDTIFSLDCRGYVTYVSPVIAQLISYRAEEVTGQPLARFVHPEDLPKFLYCMKNSLTTRFEAIEFRVVDKQGGMKHVRASTRPLIVKDQSVGLAGILSDITKWKWTERQIRSSSFRDSLTGLYNRGYFEEEVKRLDTPRQFPLSIILGDVNSLKLVNDVFGHKAGDTLLAKVAFVLQQCCRKEDVIGRLGGDEFGIFLPKTPYQETVRIVNRIKMACCNGDLFPVKLSIALGAVTKEDASRDIHVLMKEAEDRMYRDKLMEGKRVQTSIISSMRQILFEKKDETEEHTRRVKELATQVGLRLGLPSHVLEGLGLFATLHDIGKITVPETISHNPNTLSLEEWRVIWRHPEIGYRIAASCPELAGVAEAILCHHEWWDGTGYPRGLKAETIPLLSRILSIADAYDVMTHGRPSRKPMSRERALNEIKKGAGTQFAPELVDVFLEVVSDTSGEQKTSHKQTVVPSPWSSLTSLPAKG